MVKVAEKWGFGNAPLKSANKKKNEKAIRIVVGTIHNFPEEPNSELLEAISIVKGQFTRMVKQDQWDWYTVWTLLGRPSRKPANAISKKLGQLRYALKNMDFDSAEKYCVDLKSSNILRYLDNYLAGGRDETSATGSDGWIYILSERSQPQYLKIGVTTRSVEVRVKEINSATGVMIPYGVRAVWKVSSAREAERDIHALLAQYRIRRDREFFEIEFKEASRIINNYLKKKRVERSGVEKRNLPS